jgi:GNAT superfamily N-acetyltransferase
MRLHLACPTEFDRLRSFRESIFSAELGVQEGTYQDVFNDYFSKNVLLEHGGRLAGAARLAFSREAQEFYFSYLALAPEWRGHTAARLLLGTLFLLMKVNGISTVRADSNDQNLPMYLSAGCRVSGARFTKYGFRCAWTPLKYVLGTHPEAEARLMRRVQACLPADSQCVWQFPIKLVLCSSRQEYRRVFQRLVSSGEIMGVVPHFAQRGPETKVSLSEQTPQAQVVHRDSLKKGNKEFQFPDLNSCFNSDHRIIVTVNSRFREIAQTYACLTRKSVEFVLPSALATSAFSPAKSRLFVLTREELPALLNSDAYRSQPCPMGLATGDTDEEVSTLLLRNYFEFTAPLHSAHSLPITVIRANACAAARNWKTPHTFICPSDTPDEPVSFLRCLLRNGYTAGEAVRFSILSFSDRLRAPVLLAGDPSLRYAPSRLCETSDHEFSVPAIRPHRESDEVKASSACAPSPHAGSGERVVAHAESCPGPDALHGLFLSNRKRGNRWSTARR